jgi:OmpW family
MKKSAFIVLALLLSSVPAMAGSVGIFGSTYAPQDTDSGEGVGIDVELGSGQLRWLLRSTLYDRVTTDANPVAYDIEIVPSDLGFTYHFGSSRLSPHVGGGLTYAVFHFDGDVTQTVNLPNAAAISPEFGFFAEVGVDFPVGRKAAIFADVVGRSLEAEVQGDDVGLVVDQKVDVGGVAVHLGVAVTWQ